jgi:hypothetical protein
MADKSPTPSGSNARGTPVPNPKDNPGTLIDDQASRDGGKPTENEAVTKEQMEKIEEKALDHTKDEPGS